MIKNVRVDHRLLHGQVAFSWTKFLGTDCILLASDSLVQNDLKMSAMKLAKPTGIKLVMKSIDDSIKAINSGVTDKYKLFIITESIEDVYKLSNAVDQIKAITIGGTKTRADRREISKAVFISESDEKMLRELNDNGVNLEAQLVPSENKHNIMNLL